MFLVIIPFSPAYLNYNYHFTGSDLPYQQVSSTDINLAKVMNL